MLKKHCVAGALAVLLGPLCAQDMQLSGGTLTVQPGTRITLNGPLAWTIQSDAQVVNHGEIDLGAQAALNELPGNPVTGDGIERAVRQLDNAFIQEEPGGLGLTLSAAQGIGAVEVVRGHNPIVLPSGDASVARWYAVDAAPQPGLELELRYAYDATELNGLEAANLILFSAPSALGPWTALLSLPDPPMNSITALQQSPWALFTAFDADAETGLTETEAASFIARPTLAEGDVEIACTGPDRIERVELLDTHGRTVREFQPRNTRAVLSTDGLAPGHYLLRVNGTRAIRIVKP